MKKMIKNTVLECVGIAVVGTVFGLVANGLHGRGVDLSRDYFPTGKIERPTTQPDPPIRHPGANTQPGSDTQPGEPPIDDPELKKAIEDILNDGLQVIRHDDVVALYQDPLYRGGGYVFVDARNTRLYRAGHIPGAYQLDHYYIEDYIDQVMPACQNAFKVVGYCSGGECEDSRFAALELGNRGLDPTRIYVYPGGMKAWRKANLPVERGERNSADIVAGQSLPGDGHE